MDTETIRLRNVLKEVMERMNEALQDDGLDAESFCETELPELHDFILRELQWDAETGVRQYHRD